MKNSSILLSVLAFIFLAASCQKEDPVADENDNPEFSAADKRPFRAWKKTTR